MGDLRTVGGRLEHEVAAGDWRAILIDSCGAPLGACLHGEMPKAVVDEVTGYVVVELGGQTVSLPAAAAAALADELLVLAGRASEATVAAEHARRMERMQGEAAGGGRP